MGLTARRALGYLMNFVMGLVLLGLIALATALALMLWIFR